MAVARRLPNDYLWETKINLETHNWQKWSQIVEKFVFDSEARFFDVLVPTMDTAKYGYIAEVLFREQRPVMFTGDTGVGKSVLATTTMQRLQKQNVIPVFLNFSAQTSSIATQVNM